MQPLFPAQIRSNAKINLFLYVTGKRADGYHILYSLFYPLYALADEITIAPSAEVKDRVEFLNVPYIAHNTIEKALYVCKQELGIVGNFTVKVQKNIPIAAGLGGGSSNAAAIITFFIKHYALKISQAQQIALAASIGSDVPFFIHNHPTLIRGVGEVLEPPPPEILELLQGKEVVLIMPNFSSYTAEVFANFKLKERPPITNPQIGHNDLVEAATQIQPQLGELLEGLQILAPNDISGMTGTGSTCFVLVPKARAKELKEKISAHFLYYRVQNYKL